MQPKVRRGWLGGMEPGGGMGMGGIGSSGRMGAAEGVGGAWQQPELWDWGRKRGHMREE